MRKILALLFAASMLFAACSGSTSVATDQIADEAEDSLETLSDDDNSDEPTDDQDNNDATAGNDNGDDDGDDDDDADEARTVSAIDDIPQVCRDLMAEFLRDIEPIVSPIDWDEATLADFETISVEFEARADQFDTDSGASGECDDIELEDDESLDLLVEFADREAPGTVGFLEFISDFANVAVDAVTGTDGASFSTCEDAIAFMDNLMAEYDSLEEVPVAELTAMAQIATVIFTCTPEQVEYFDSPEVSAFFDEFFG